MIKVEIRHAEYQYRPTKQEQGFFNDYINETLQPIMMECVAWSAKVDVCLTLDSPNYIITPVCDDYKTQIAMQELLPRVIPPLS